MFRICFHIIGEKKAKGNHVSMVTRRVNLQTSYKRNNALNVWGILNKYIYVYHI